MCAATEKPVRKFPPPCWTQDEALALVEAYRERWYALRRGYLRTADWDAVAEAVGVRCPDASPAKTSAQCRHKMEKLRQRYRAEKQRSLSFPGRFFSSWFYFEAMDAMENGSNPEAGDLANSGIKNLVSTKTSGDSTPNFEHQGLNPGRGIRFKPVSDRNSAPLGTRSKNSCKSNMKSSPNFGSRVSNEYLSYLDVGSDQEQDDGGEFEDGFLVETPIDENLVPPGYRSKDFGKIHKSFAPKFHSDHRVSGDGVDVSGGGFRVKAPIYQESERPGLRPRKFSKVDPKVNPNFWDDGNYNRIDADGECWVKVPREGNMVTPGFRGKFSGKPDRNSNPNPDTSGLNGFSSLGKKSSCGSGGGGFKRESGAVADMVSSIKFLGDGFMKMEKMKMEMAREIEKMRMETEMKRNELILESQKQIVDAFVKGLIENKKKKHVVTDS